MESTPQDTSTQMSKMPFIIGGVLLIAIVVALIFVFVVNSDDSDDANNSDQSTPVTEGSAPVPVEQNDIDATIDRLRSNYVAEWTLTTPADTPSEDGREIYSFVSPVADETTVPIIVQLRVGTDARKGLFDKAQLNFGVNRFIADSTDTLDGLAGMSSVFSFDQADVQSIQSDITNLSNAIVEDGQEKSVIKQIKNTQYTLYISDPGEGNGAVGIVDISVLD